MATQNLQGICTGRPVRQQHRRCPHRQRERQAVAQAVGEEHAAGRKQQVLAPQPQHSRGNGIAVDQHVLVSMRYRLLLASRSRCELHVQGFLAGIHGFGLWPIRLLQFAQRRIGGEQHGGREARRQHVVNQRQSRLEAVTQPFVFSGAQVRVDHQRSRSQPGTCEEGGHPQDTVAECQQQAAAGHEATALEEFSQAVRRTVDLRMTPFTFGRDKRPCVEPTSSRRQALCFDGEVHELSTSLTGCGLSDAAWRTSAR